MDLGSTALALLGLLLAAWTAAAAWLMIAAASRSRGAEAARRNAKRMARLLDEAPAAALVVRSDGRLEGSDRLAHWLSCRSSSANWPNTPTAGSAANSSTS